MKEFIAAQIERIGNIKEKIALKELLNSVFVEMYETCEAKYDALEQRVLEEIPLLSRQYSVHTTVMERERADESQTYLFPMVETDLFAPVEFDPPEVQQILDTSGSCRLFSVFYEKDYLDCRALLDKKRVFGGTVRIGEKKIPARFIIKRAERYFDCVAGLYQLFYSNNVDWQTVNAPYLTKFVDVCFIGTEDGSPLQAGEESAGFTVDFEEYERDIRRDLIPVWNVKKNVVKANDFPVAAEDKINYEYYFDLQKLGVENGYLVDGEEMYVCAANRVGDQLRVVSPVERNVKWTLYSIVKKKEVATEILSFPLMTNDTADTFAGRLLSRFGTAVKTGAELKRLVGAYGVEEYIKLAAYSLEPPGVSGEGYTMNPFIIEEIRDPDYKRTMLLRFTQVKNHFLNRDIMSFLVSQVQFVFPEYACVGVLE